MGTSKHCVQSLLAYSPAPHLFIESEEIMKVEAKEIRNGSFGCRRERSNGQRGRVTAFEVAVEALRTDRTSKKTFEILSGDMAVDEALEQL